eukprot:1949121-Pyramimonas_sp.AAC.1
MTDQSDAGSAGERRPARCGDPHDSGRGLNYSEQRYHGGGACDSMLVGPNGKVWLRTDATV